MERNATYGQVSLSKILLIFLLLFTGVTLGQSTANYTFSTATNGSLIDMSSGTTDIFSTGTYRDDVASTIQEIGFTFVFMGTPYTQFSINSNGQMRLGGTVIAGGAQSPAASVALIAPISGDNALRDIGKAHLKVSGSSPNRVLVVEWKEVRVPFSSSAESGTYCTFQALLYETSGVIEFRYGRMYNMSTSTQTRGVYFSIGTTSGQIGQITDIVTTPAYNSSGTSLTLTTFGLSSDMINLNSTSDGNRRVFTFTPGDAPIAPSGLNFTGVGLVGMTLNWTDNSANEIGFAIYRSDDGGTTYNYIAKANADAISYPATGLTPGTNYYWQVTALNEGRQSTTAGGNQATTTPSLSGTKTVGTGENYETLTAALLDLTNQGLAGSVILELTGAYSGSAETLPLTLSNFPGLSESFTLTIRPANGVTNRSLILSQAGPIFDFNGAKYITIDGRPGGTGSSVEFTIQNDNTSNPAIRFINDANNNNIRYCNVKGAVTTTTSGVILFSNTTGTNGNDNNTIEYCNISDGATTPSNLIYSSGTTTTSEHNNSNNTLANCNLFNFFNASGQSSGILLSTGNTDWTIQNNHFYQTTARTHSTTSGLYRVISIETTSGNNFTVNGNFIGGNESNAGGIAWTQSGSGNNFIGIRMSCGTSTASNVQGNTIKNISITTSTTSTVSAGISVTSGSVNIGSSIGNIIGGMTSTGSIIWTGSGAGANFKGINYEASGVANVQNNSIGGITVTGAGTTLFRGIQVSSGTSGNYQVVANNTIGGNIENSISNSTNNDTYGIHTSSTTPNYTITGNTVRNISHTSTLTAGEIWCIYSQGLTSNISNNYIYNVSTTTTSTTIQLIGITITNTSSVNNTVSQNSVYNLIQANSGSGTTHHAYGIYINVGTSTASSVTRNFVHSLKLSTTGSAATTQIRGIMINAGAVNVINNMIRIGIDAEGNPIIGNYFMQGIEKVSTGTVNIYFNSVYVGGASVGNGSQSTYAYRRNGTGNEDLRNNIFVNARSNGTGTGKHYAISINNSTTFQSNFNLFHVTGTGGVLGYNGTADQTTLSGWQTTTSKDYNSGYGDPNYVAPAVATPDLHVQSPTPIEASGTDIASVIDDFDGQTRSGLSPVDIGADAGIFTFIDIIPPVITYTILNNTASTSNRTLASVTMTDVTGVPTSGGLQPRLWFRKSSGTPSTWVSTQGSLQSGTGTNGVWNFTIDYSQIPITPAFGETYQYYIAAQDGATTPNISTNPAGGVHTNVNTQTSAPGTPNSYKIVAGFAGNYDVGTGKTYTTLTGMAGFFNALNNGALTGNVTVNITSNLSEDCSYDLNQINTDGSYTLTIQPSAASERVISITTMLASDITLNGADNVTIDGRFNGSGKYLRFRNTFDNQPTLTLMNDASGNTIRDCYIEGATTLTSNGVVFLSTGTTTGNDNNIIQNCIVRDLSDGSGVPANLIYSVGSSTSVRNSGNIIYNNELFNFTSTGIFLASTSSGNENFTVIGNTIYQGAARTTALYGMQLNTLNTANMVAQNIIRDLNTSSTAYGIYINNVGTVDVTKNRIYNFPSTSGSTSNLIGIYNWGSSPVGISNIYNNQISIIPSFTNAQTVYGIRDWANAGDVSNIYYNSVYIGGTGSGTSKSYAFDDAMTSTFDVLRNNLFVNARTGGSGGHFVARSAGTSGITDLNSNYNFYAGNGPTLGNNFELSSTAKSFTEWKAAFTGSGKDANSWSVNTTDITPANLFYNVATGNLNINYENTDCWLVNGKGTVTFGCADDFDGAGVRSTITGVPTDIGSDEFNTGTTPPAITLNTPVAGANNIVQNGRTLGTITFAPVEATLPTALEIQYFPGQDPPAPLTGNYSKAYWSVTATGGEGYSYDLTLNYDPAQIGTITNEDNIKLAKRNAGVWTHLGASVVNTTNKTITMTGLTSFSEFALSDNVSPLPVELASFTSNVNGRDVTLNWSTKTEVSSNRFVLERSLSSHSSSLSGHSLWERVGEVKASGNSNSPKEYSFTDKKLNSGNYSYRLKMIDNDGSFDYSDVIEAEVEIPKTFALNQNYPNPFNPSTIISYQLPVNSRVRLELYSITGEKVATLIDEEQEAGYFNYQLSTVNYQLSSGVYIYRIVAGDYVSVKKLVVLK